MILETATQKRVKKELDKQQKGFSYASKDEMIKDYKLLRGQVKKNINQLLKAERGELKGRYESLNDFTSFALFSFKNKNIDLDLDPKTMDEKTMKNHLIAFSRFLISETGTLKNWQKYQKKVIDNIKQITGVKDLDVDEFFKIWERIKELKLDVKAEALFNLGSEEIMEYIGNKMEGGLTSDELIQTFKDYLKELTDEQIRREEEELIDPFDL